jgi:hypothetical protein
VAKFKSRAGQLIVSVETGTYVIVNPNAPHYETDDPKIIEALKAQPDVVEVKDKKISAPGHKGGSKR